MEMSTPPTLSCGVWPIYLLPTYRNGWAHWTLYYVEAWISTVKRNSGASPSPLWSIWISGVGQMYLIGGSSNAAFPCHFCNNLLLLFTSTGSAICDAVDIRKAFDTVGRWQLFQSLVTAGIPYTHVIQAVWWLDQISVYALVKLLCWSGWHCVVYPVS